MQKIMVSWTFVLHTLFSFFHFLSFFLQFFLSFVLSQPELLIVLLFFLYVFSFLFLAFYLSFFFLSFFSYLLVTVVFIGHFATFYVVLVYSDYTSSFYIRHSFCRERSPQTYFYKQTEYIDCNIICILTTNTNAFKPLSLLVIRP